MFRMRDCLEFQYSMYTYIIHDPGNDIYKIGKTRNPSKRLYTIKRINPFVELVFLYHSDIENILHQCYEHKRVHAEWFQLNIEDINKIQNEYRRHRVRDLSFFKILSNEQR